MTNQRYFKQLLLYLLVGSVILAVVLGIAIVLRNAWGWFEVRVVLTTLTIAAASICGLACDAARVRLGRNLFSMAGLTVTVAAALMILIGMWGDIKSEVYWKTTICTSIFAVATTHVCLLSIARLARRFRWVLAIAYQIIFGLAALIAVMIVMELNSERMFRILAAMSILDAGISLTIPILHRISRTDPTSPPAPTLLDEKNLAALEAEIAQLQQRIGQLERVREGMIGGG
jgi:hypothetical protein